MNWITDKKPDETGPYLISAERPMGAGKYVFTYVAHYEKEQDKWYKYDPFIDKYKPVEELDGVVAWGKDIGVFVR